MPGGALSIKVVNCYRLARDFPGGKTIMADYGFTHGKVVDAGGCGASGIVKLIGMAFVGLLAVIFAFSSFTTIHTGHVGVLTLYGEVTGQVLEAGFHFVNPLK